MGSTGSPAATAMEIERSEAPLAKSTAAPPVPRFEAMTAHEMSAGRIQFRKVPVPAHRFSPLKRHWMEIYTPVYEQMKVDVRMNLKIQIKVETGYRSEPFTMNLNPMGLLSTLKLTLHRKFGFRNEQLILFLNGKNLLEDSSLESCGIKTGVTLLLGYKGRFLVSFCRWYSSTEYLAEVDCFDTVSMLKEKISEMGNYATKNLFLIHTDTKVKLEDPERTLFSYGIFRRKIGGEIHHINVRQPRKYRPGRWYA